LVLEGLCEGCVVGSVEFGVLEFLHWVAVVWCDWWAKSVDNVHVIFVLFESESCKYEYFTYHIISDIIFPIPETYIHCNLIIGISNSNLFKDKCFLVFVYFILLFNWCYICNNIKLLIEYFFGI
jgi:hypothetical protein